MIRFCSNGSKVLIEDPSWEALGNYSDFVDNRYLPPGIELIAR